jgi:hypothetical protein
LEPKAIIVPISLVLSHIDMLIVLKILKTTMIPMMNFKTRNCLPYNSTVLL